RHRRSQKERGVSGAVHRHVRGEPVSDRRDSQVLDRQIRNCRPQHVCQAVPADRRSQPLSPSNRHRPSLRRQWPRLESVRQSRSVLRVGQWRLEPESTLRRRDAATPEARVVSARVHLGPQSGGERRPLLAVRFDRQHAIANSSIVNYLKRRSVMSNVLQRATATVGAIMASLLFVTTALAQMPTSPWKKGAPFPEPDEELYGVAVNGKMYVIGGWGDGKARGVNYEYDPATDRWTKKQPMPRPAHHAALTAVNGKIYAFGGFVAPATNAIPVGAAWEPIDNAWEFTPATDSWKPLPPLPGKRGSAIAAAVDGKIYVIGGATTMEGSKDTFFTAFGPARVLGT